MNQCKKPIPKMKQRGSQQQLSQYSWDCDNYIGSNREKLDIV